ncbi:MAG: hypothetical protein WC477_00840 [Patescibacteria group bacterium]
MIELSDGPEEYRISRDIRCLGKQKTMSQTRFAVFTTSELNASSKPTLVLEQAKNEGYAIVIISSRSHLAAKDLLWLHLVDTRNILLASKNTSVVNLDISLDQWRNLYKHIGLEDAWDSHYTEPMQARLGLRLSGVKLGSNFRGIDPAQTHFQQRRAGIGFKASDSEFDDAINSIAVAR